MAEAEPERASIIEEEDKERWIKYYSSIHQILLVGEGDFSFSLSLANSFCAASNIVATSLDRYDTVIEKYSEAKSNLESLDKLGATILHGVDATKMNFRTDFPHAKFDRIIFNFPHAGFHGKEVEGRQIKLHRNLVQGFFKSASHMLRPYGEVHVNHKTTSPFNHWNLEELASGHSLGLIECLDFKREDYPGYNNKRGAGTRCDEPFLLGECSTFKFRFIRNMKKKTTQVTTNVGYAQPLQVQGIHSQLQQPISLFEINYPRADFITNVSYTQPFQVQEIPSQLQHPSLFEINYPRADFIVNMHSYMLIDVGSMSRIRISNECSRIFNGYFTDTVDMFGRAGYDVGGVLQRTLRIGFERYMAEAPGRDIHGHIMLLRELHHVSILRSAWLRRMLVGPS